MLGLSPYADEFLKLAVSKEMATFVKSRKGKLRVGKLTKKADAVSSTLARRLGLGSLLAAGSAGTLVAQSAAKDWSTGRKYNNAVREQQKELLRRRKAELQGLS